MVSPGVNSPIKKWSNPFVSCTPYDDFNPLPKPIYFSKSHKYENYHKAPHSLLLPLFSSRQTSSLLHGHLQAHGHRELCNEVGSQELVQHLVGLNRYPSDSECSALLTQFSKGLTHKKANLKEPFNQDIKVKVTRSQTLHKIFNPKGIECRRCFSSSTPYLWC